MKCTTNKTFLGVVLIVILAISTIPLWSQQQKTDYSNLHQRIDDLTEIVKANNKKDVLRLTSINKTLKKDNRSLVKIATLLSLSTINYTLFACQMDLNQVSESDTAYEDLYVVSSNYTYEPPANSESQTPQLLEEALMKKFIKIIGVHETLLKKIDDNFINNPLYAKITSRREVLSTVNGDLQSMKASFEVIAHNQAKLEDIVKAM